ncbi:DUF397 domain-containing protein [Microbispora sp. ZYX-F-249]|uniref:DUF397 domain-containing protein n=1 Tax=Microbispora maris TaxID=3144104 RepID=A0ABV0ALA4_9ACTN
MELESETFGNELEWRSASRCGGGNCVQVALIGDRVALRDSKHPDHGMIVCSRQEWRDFVAAIKAGSHAVTQ